MKYKVYKIFNKYMVRIYNSKYLCNKLYKISNLMY